jgi:hypothetical protein
MNPNEIFLTASPGSNPAMSSAVTLLENVQSRLRRIPINRRMRLLYRCRSVFWPSVSLSRRGGSGLVIVAAGSPIRCDCLPPREDRSFQRGSAGAYPNRIERPRGSQSTSRGWQVCCRHVPARFPHHIIVAENNRLLELNFLIEYFAPGVAAIPRRRPDRAISAPSTSSTHELHSQRTYGIRFSPAKCVLSLLRNLTTRYSS